MIGEYLFSQMSKTRANLNICFGNFIKIIFKSHSYIRIFFSADFTLIIWNTWRINCRITFCFMVNLFTLINLNITTNGTSSLFSAPNSKVHSISVTTKIYWTALSNFAKSVADLDTACYNFQFCCEKLVV